MKKLTTLLLCGFISVSLFGQKQQNNPHEENVYDESFAQIHYWDFKLGNALDTQVIKSLVARQFYFNENDGLRVTHISRSLTATHINFQQVYKGIDVFGGGIKVAISRNNILFRGIETLFNTNGSISDVQKYMDVNAALAEFKDVVFLENKPVYLWNGENIVPGWYAKFNHDRYQSHEATWFANNERYFVRDLLAYDKDTVVTGKVFHPDPITPISKVYGGVYVDNSDNNGVVLNPLRKEVSLQVTFENGLFALKNEYVEIVDMDAPFDNPVKSPTPEFSFSRSLPGFEQVNSFYHITETQKYLQSIGYLNLNNAPILVDANAYNGQDNSSFNPNSNPAPSLFFGNGGVDDAEDADVVVHEYGHAISYRASPNTNVGFERRCLDEAFGDYIAVSYTRDEFSFGKNLVFNWDGHNPFWVGRTVNNPDNICYDDILSFSNVHQYTTVFNAAMFEIYDKIGKTATDKLQIEALFGYSSNMTFTEAALMILDADTALFGGAHSIDIWDAFDKRCILDWTSVDSYRNDGSKPYSVKNTLLTANTPLFLNIRANNAFVSVLDLNGRIVLEKRLDSGASEIYLNGLSNGMYLINIQINQHLFTEKIVLAN